MDISGKDNVINVDKIILQEYGKGVVVKNVDAGIIEQLNKIRFKVRKIVHKRNPKMVSYKDLQLVVGNDTQFIVYELKNALITRSIVGN